MSIPGDCKCEDGEELINELNSSLELRSENHIELHVKDVGKRDTRIKIENSGYNLAGLGHFKNEIFSELKTVKHRDVEDMV